MITSTVVRNECHQVKIQFLFSDFFRASVTNQNNLFDIFDQLSDCCSMEDVFETFEKRRKIAKLAVELEYQVRLSKIDEKYKTTIAETNAKCRSSTAESEASVTMPYKQETLHGKKRA